MKKNASTPKINQGCGSANERVGQLAAPPLFNRRYPTSLKGARASEATIHAPCIECLKNATLETIIPSVPCVPTYREHRRCTASVLSPVSPLLYDHRFRRLQRHRAKPIPLRRRRNFFRLRKKHHEGACAVISRCRKATYHISLARYITLIRKELIYLETPKDTKSSIIAFRVTPEERAWIEKHSYGNYRIISDFVRDCVFKKDVVIVKGLDEFSKELRRIGNNLNQLTRAVNAGYVRAVDLTETKEEVEKLWQSLNSLLRDAP